MKKKTRFLLFLYIPINNNQKQETLIRPHQQCPNTTNSCMHILPNIEELINFIKILFLYIPINNNQTQETLIHPRQQCPKTTNSCMHMLPNIEELINFTKHLSNYSYISLYC